MLGPVLYFRGEQAERWRLSALYVLEGGDEPPDLAVEGVGLSVPPRHVVDGPGRSGPGGDGPDWTAWRFDFAAPRARTGRRIGYGFPGGETRYVTLPALGVGLRLACVACNGTENEALPARGPVPRNARWTDLLNSHHGAPIHLMLHLGDQVYADGVWRECPALAAWRALPRSRRLEHPFTPAMAEQVDTFYFQLYLRTWRQAEVAAALAAIPSVMIWDDHDILDGWGSLPPEVGACPVYQGIFAAARRHFALFQLGTDPDRLIEWTWGGAFGSFSQGYRLGNLGILAPDLRSERTPEQVLGAATWAALPDWLDRFAGCRHLLLVSSIPMVLPDIGWLETLLRRTHLRPALQDDLRDQWRSPAHRDEWLRLARQLVAFSRRTGARVTILSGEIHLGAHGLIRGGGAEIWQLIVSGIVHPPPGALYAAALDRLAAGNSTANHSTAEADGLTVMMPPFAGTGRRFLRTRAWLSLTVDRAGSLTARWHGEGEPPIHELAI